jgi:MFS family permease
MSWIVVGHHDGIASITLLMACFWGPNVLFGPFMGVLADRISRQWIIITSDFMRGCIFIVFSILLTDHFSVTAVYIMMLFVGVSFSAFYSSAFAFLRELVPQHDLMHANTTIDIIYEAGNLVGMGGAGLLIAWTSAETAIFINGIAFLIAAIATFSIPKKALCHGSKKVRQPIHLIQDFVSGLQYLVCRKKLIFIYTTQLLIFITFLTTPLLLVPFSKTVLHATVEQFGIIEACASIGIVVGGFFMSSIAERFGLFRTVLFFCCVLCATFSVFGYNRAINLAAALYFMIGFSGAVWPLVITKAQRLTDIDFQGRVQSTFNSLSGATMMLFYLCIGYAGQYIHVAHLYFIEVGIAALAIVFLLSNKKIDV